MIWLLSVIGAVAVIDFVLFLALGLTRGWDHPMARMLLRVAVGLGIVCAVIGVLIAILGS